MKKTGLRIMFLMVLFMGNINSHAQDKVLGIIVELANGQKVEYRLADNPKFVFDGQTIKLTAESVAVEYTPSELAKVTTGEVIRFSCLPSWLGLRDYKPNNNN